MWKKIKSKKGILFKSVQQGEGVEVLENLKEKIREYTREKLGFSLFGVSSPGEFRKYPRVVGDFGGKKIESQFPDEVMPECRAVIVLGMESKTDIFDTIISEERLRASFYHEVIHYRLYLLREFLRKQGYEALIPEKVSHKRAAILGGLGEPGKNTLVTNSDLGSNFRIGVLLTTLDLSPDPPGNPFNSEICGDCEKCLTSCPVEAITPYNVDFSRCIIPKLDLEKKTEEGEKAYNLHKHLSPTAFIECNICQKACPYNS